MIKTCKNPPCHKTFDAPRADAQYCSGACRVAVHRKRTAPPPRTFWLPRVSEFSTRARSEKELSNAELAVKLVELADSRNPRTGRQFYYLALSHGYINPDMGASATAKGERDAAYERVTEILGRLRKQGRIAWKAVLDLTRDLDTPIAYNSPRDFRAMMRAAYDEDRWFGQEYFPILIVEKDTLEPVCKPMARAWRMPFASSRGYSSLTLQHDMAEMIRDRHARTGQKAIVYFVSDLDPSGLDLQRDWEETLQDFAASVADFVRLGLTMAQVEDDDLDIARLGIGVKPSDSRSRDFVERYGRTCWEADILPATEIETALEDQINRWLDRDLWDRRDAEIEQARRLL
jgi:hypothetical protein